MFAMYAAIFLAVIIIRPGAPKDDNSNSTLTDALADSNTTTTTLGFVTLAPSGLNTTTINTPIKPDQCFLRRWDTLENQVRSSHRNKELPQGNGAVGF